MALTLPGWLVEAISYLGYDFPASNEDVLHQWADHLKALDRTMDAAHQDLLAAIAHVREHNEGPAAEAFLAHVSGPDSDADALVRFSEGCEIAAAGCDYCAYAVVVLKAHVGRLDMDDEKTLLWAAVEDYAGLWTAPWELRALHPQQSSQELVARARPILGRFLKGGLIHLYSCQEPDGEPILIDDSRASEILEAEDSWDEPTGDWLVTLFSATPEGEAAYNGMF